MNMAQYGRIEIHLADLLEKSGLSKNKLCHRAEMQRTQINGYCNNTISRLDIDVLARLCYALNCDEYYGAAEPPVRCGESHLSGLTEPPHFVY